MLKFDNFKWISIQVSNEHIVFPPIQSQHKIVSEQSNIQFHSHYQGLVELEHTSWQSKS